MTQSLGDAAGLGASAYSSDDVLCMMYGVDVDKEDAKHKVALSADGGRWPRFGRRRGRGRGRPAAGRVPATTSNSNVGGESNAGGSNVGVADLFRNIWSAIIGVWQKTKKGIQDGRRRSRRV